MRRLRARLAGAVVAVALIVVGAVLAARPVSDEHVRANATDTATGHITAVRDTWDGSQVLTVAWPYSWDQTADTQFENYGASPQWHVGNEIQVSFNPDQPATDAVLADPSWTFAIDFRADAVFQAVVPFTLACIVLALAVFWPAGPWLFGAKARRPRRSLQRYILTPAVGCALVAAGAVVIQDQPLSAYSMGADKIVGWLSVVLMLLLIWPYVRAVQYFRLRQLLTVPDDAVGTVGITSVAGRHVQIGGVRLTALVGQRPRQFRAGDHVRLYGRWDRRGPALITDGEKMLIGLAKRFASAPQDSTAGDAVADQPGASAVDIAEPLIQEYPQLARHPRLYLARALILLVIVVVGSITIIAAAGREAVGPLWAAWIPAVLFIDFCVRRFRLLSRLLRSPYVSLHGVVTSVTGSGRGTRVATVAMRDHKTLQLRVIGGQKVSWLADDQEVVLRRLPTLATHAVVLTTEGGHAALAIATVVRVQDATAVGSAS